MSKKQLFFLALALLVGSLFGFLAGSNASFFCAAWLIQRSQGKIRRRHISYQRPKIHFAPRIVSQTAANSTASTMTLASRAIESRSPSSSR